MSETLVGIPVDDATYHHLHKMIKGISFKYNGWGGMLAEDIEMELWIKTLEIIKSTQVVNLNIIARSCYNRAIDMYRQTKSKYHQLESPIDQQSLEYRDSRSDTGSRYSVDYILSKSPGSDYSSVVVYDILQLFEKGTKEHQYVLLVANYTDALSGTSHVIDLSTLLGSQRIEKEFALQLGYRDDTSSGYRKLKYKVQKAITRYQQHYDKGIKYNLKTN